eukprot:scaffold136140_cov36-Tisochrysis_lutea.AAC.3
MRHARPRVKGMERRELSQRAREMMRRSPQKVGVASTPGRIRWPWPNCSRAVSNDPLHSATRRA